MSRSIHSEEHLVFRKMLAAARKNAGLTQHEIAEHSTLSRRARSWKPATRWQRHPQEDGPLHVLADSKRENPRTFSLRRW
jgi:hypothetical protein